MAWIWICTYSKHWGVDLERCGAASRKSFKTEEQAAEAGRRHIRNCFHQGHEIETKNIGRRKYP